MASAFQQSIGAVRPSVIRQRGFARQMSSPPVSRRDRQDIPSLIVDQLCFCSTSRIPISTSTGKRVPYLPAPWRAELFDSDEARCLELVAELFV